MEHLLDPAHHAVDQACVGDAAEGQVGAAPTKFLGEQAWHVVEDTDRMPPPE